MSYSIFLIARGLIAFLSSCYSYKEVSELQEIESYKTRRSVHVLKASADTISLFFTEKIPGKLLEDKVSGIFQFPLYRLTADSIFYKPVKYKSIVDYVYKDGVRYDAFEENGQVYVFNKEIPVNIPYHHIKSVNLKIYKPGSTTALVGGTLVSLTVLGTIILLNMTFNLSAY